MSPKLSICIATHERSHLLQRVLESIARQNRLPDEIVISDSSSTDASWQVVKTFIDAHPNLSIKFCQSDRKALPWQRWLAFSNSSGDIVFFLDDDIRLDQTACARIIQAFSESSDLYPSPAGVGLITTLEDEIPHVRASYSWQEYWLGISQTPSGTITPGGITVTHAGLTLNNIHAVKWLWGASMAYRRDVLDAIGPLHGLFELYDFGIGKGEDAVISVQAGRYGQLFLLTDKLAYHPPLEKAIRTANAHSGWLFGLRETVGRCHTMRWISTDSMAFKKDWMLYVTRELVMSMKDLLYKPLRRTSWSRLTGCLFGVFWCISHWKTIPHSPKEAVNLSGIPT